MPLVLNVGLSKKHSLPDYGSIGATCNVTVELDTSLLQSDLETFHRHVRNAYVACSQAVNDELARQRPNEVVVVATNINIAPPAPPSTAAANANTNTSGNGSNGNGAQQPGNGNGKQPLASALHRASQKQLEFAVQLSRQIKGLGVRKLEDLAYKLFTKPLADLTSFDASSLIDTLKAVKEGRVTLAALTDGAAT
jgi:hypothetical protein